MSGTFVQGVNLIELTLQNYNEHDKGVLLSLRKQDTAESVSDSHQGRYSRVLPVKETANQHEGHEGSSEHSS